MHYYNNESIYFAAPVCFYKTGFHFWNSQADLGKYHGFNVTMPHGKGMPENYEEMSPEDRAQHILNNCIIGMDETTVILANLEFFRGTEPDGGTIFEVGYCYANNSRCYGFTRDKRNMEFKHQNSFVKDFKKYESPGKPLPYSDLPFGVCVTAAMKITEGNQVDGFNMVLNDLEEERKRGKRRDNDETIYPVKKGDKPLIYLATLDRYEPDAKERYAKMKAVCAELGFDAIAPTDIDDSIAAIADPYERAYKTFEYWQSYVRGCDIIITELTDYHGLEPSADIAFEAGMATKLGKKSYAYMEDARIMRERMECKEDEKGSLRDAYDLNVENFNAPVNLMFKGSKMFGGKFDEIIKEVAADLKG